jgi:hypothetical protein
MTAAVFDQDSFRFRAGDSAGLNEDSDWAADTNIDVDWKLDTPFRIRFLVQETAGGMVGNQRFALHEQVDGGGWGALTSAWYNVTSSQYADDDTTTQLIGSGTYVSGDRIPLPA